jgi:hypothetical protein
MEALRGANVLLLKLLLLGFFCNGASLTIKRFDFNSERRHLPQWAVVGTILHAIGCW